MKTQPQDTLYYRRRLEEFLRERHPQLLHAGRLLETRSLRAAETYREAIDKGESPLTASTRAETVLYEGLIFSRYDTLRCILQTEFPLIPAEQYRSLALTLQPLCEEIFLRYNLDDGLVTRSEYNHLIMELTQRLRSYFEQNNLFTRRRGRPTKKDKNSK